MTHPGGGSTNGGQTGPGRAASVKTTVYLKLEQRIAADEFGGIKHRWEFGRALLKEKVGRQKLPDGMLASLVAAATAAGLKVSEREIQRRIKCAEVYGDDRQLRHACDAMGSWRALVNANFPPVDSTDPEDLEAAGISTAAPDEWEQLSLIPGLGEVLKVRGRSIPLAEATIADVEAYRDMYAGIHSNFAKRLAQIENALRIMREAQSDPDGNALDAWRRGLSDELTS